MRPAETQHILDSGILDLSPDFPKSETFRTHGEKVIQLNSSVGSVFIRPFSLSPLPKKICELLVATLLGNDISADIIL
jgi:hypothetical protein